MNSRRDGSPFMNLLQCAPLCDSQGKIRYFIGAQIDVSGLAMEGAQMESLQNLNAEIEARDNESVQQPLPKKTEFQELGELFSPRELQTVHHHGGNLFHPVVDKFNPTNSRLWLQSPEHEGELRLNGVQSPGPTPGGSLAGVYKHVCFFLINACSAHI
jgi:hypothetical protein